VKSYSSWSEIACGFRLFVFLSAILSLTSNAFGGSGQITPNPSTLNFGPISVGTSQSQPVTLTNSGGSKATITQVTLSGTDFTFSGLNYPVTLAGGQSVTGQVTFIPQSSGTDSGMVSISYSTQNGNKHNNALSASNTVTLPLSGTATTTTSGQLTANPPSLSFPNVTTGSSTTLPETLTNSGGSAVTISQITPSAGFSFNGITLPLTLSATQSVTFNALFAPQSAGSVTGSLVISSNASNPTLTVTATGTGTLPGTLAVAPTSYNFNNVTVGTTVSQPGTLTASNAPVTVSSLGVSGSQFSVKGLTLPVTIAAGSNVPFTLWFAPQTSGSASANVTFASNASNSPAVEVVTGTGISPQHSVALGWNTSTSSGVVGYNIYRGTVSGGPYTRINSAVDTTPYDTDTTVQAGQTYYYVVTAVDSAGAESSYSSQAQAVIPTP
jgi:HYDIN/CFA65/VesB family protein/ASPM-SPD-2-Hydin domain-containing protein